MTTAAAPILPNATIPPRPHTMPLNPAGLPNDQLLAQRQIVGWSWTWNETKGKWDKPPLRIRDGYPASVTAPGDWATLVDAVAGVERLGFDGIGVVLTGAEGVTGIDLDKCRNVATSAIEDWAQAIIARFRSYWEPSASGTGIRIFIRAKLPPGRRRIGQIEMYDSGRYLTINGNKGVGAADRFEDRQAELNAWHAETFPPEPVRTPVHRGHPPTSADDRVVLDRCRTADNGAKFCRLYDDGDWESEGYTSHSEARAGLCSMIGFWVNRNPDRIEALFEGSALYREDKWPRERDNVLRLASQGEAFSWGSDRWQPLSSVEHAPYLGDDDLAGLLVLSHDELARLAFDRGQVADERGRRLDAIDALLTSGDMTPVERVIAYGTIKAAETRRGQQAEVDTREIIVSQSAIAATIGLSRQTVGATLTRWDQQRYMKKETRPTGRRAKTGEEIHETVIQLPATGLTDNLIIAADWKRPKGAKHVGGNGNRCPECGSTQRKKTARTVLIRTTTEACADCGHVHGETSKEIGPAETFIDFYDTERDIPTMLDMARHSHPASVDAPPIRPAPAAWRRQPSSTLGGVAELTHPPRGRGVNPPTPPQRGDIPRPVWGEAAD